MTDSWITQTVNCFIPNRISIFEQIGWADDSMTHSVTYLCQNESQEDESKFHITFRQAQTNKNPTDLSNSKSGTIYCGNVSIQC